MKCTIPEISWHNRDPVLSVDIQPKPLENDSNNLIRLASGGSDSHVLIWYIKYNEGEAQLEIASDLSRHQRAVNVVRWSPSGEYLASGDDESIIFLWKLKSENEPINILDDNNEQDRETWLIWKTLRGHLEDVYDLSWSLDSLNIVSGSVDNTAVIWDVKKGKSKGILNEHKGFVQGVAWDPRNKYVATFATDRALRLFDVNTLKRCGKINKSTYPVDEASPLHGKMIRLFHDDTLLTFYRRLCFSPDGLLIIVPSGCTDVVISNNEGGPQNPEKPAPKTAGEKPIADDQQIGVDKPEIIEKTKMINTTYIFTRYSLKKPAIVIPSPDHFTIAVRCCPLLFELRPHDEDKPPLIDLPYRMIYAVASKSSVYLYDTQQKMPFGCVSNIHYARLTDLTWSSDGTILIVSSVDGFCTMILFEKGELGTVYDKPVNLEQEDKENQAKLKKSSPKSGVKRKPINESESGATFKVEPVKVLQINQDQDKQIIVEFPETIIAMAETFESPELKEKQATPIAIRRQPRSTPTTVNGTPKTVDDQKTTTSSAQKVKPIATRRQPRSILTSVETINKTTTDQDEALDAWPVPIDVLQKSENSAFKTVKKEKIETSPEPMETSTDTQNLHLVYDGDSESRLIKPTFDSNTEISEKNSTNSEQKKIDSTASDQKTPRRITPRTISTPKSKKKLI